MRTLDTWQLADVTYNKPTIEDLEQLGQQASIDVITQIHNFLNYEST
jgi:hypothetical protein